MLTKLAMEKTLMDMEVSLRMLILRWVRWYRTVNVWMGQLQYSAYVGVM